ncbi:universal stress protein [Prosthecobacter sp.]|uniref:universal stress protein n=1 Tax=Prosthecobacter sp. TaxID=1965333 RepID=UPI001DB6CF0A|nr:universal stress protein [Prosthecobacter sp.]MCB1277483.1 universal stress protein [Prosthecobacter sp.]
MKTILALIDFSDVSSKILEHALAFAEAFGSDIVLIHVVPPEPLVVDFAPPAVPPELFEERQKDLSAMRDSLAARGVNATAQVFGGPLLETILTQIDGIDPDAVIMGSHGHGALYHLIVGSITEGVIKRATHPVLVVPSVPTLDPVRTADIKKAQPEISLNAIGGIPVPL